MSIYYDIPISNSIPSRRATTKIWSRSEIMASYLSCRFDRRYSRPTHIAVMAEYRHDAWAPSIFRASSFSRWVATTLKRIPSSTASVQNCVTRHDLRVILCVCAVNEGNEKNYFKFKAMQFFSTIALLQNNKYWDHLSSLYKENTLLLITVHYYLLH